MNNEKAKISPRCPIRTTLQLVGGKWRLLIIYQLKDQPMRFGELKKRIPEISEKMLTQELKALVVDQLILRKNFVTVPPRVEYRLTEKGLQVFPLIDAMEVFARHYDDPESHTS